jgi:outer membrane biosynthesis protein TonB
MAKNNDNRNRFLSALLTLLMGAGILALLFFTSLHYEYPPKDATVQQLLQDTIIFGGELVELGDLPELDNSQDLAANGDEIPQENESDIEQTQDAGQNDMQDQGVINEPPKPQVVSNQQESPMKVKELPPKKPQAEKKTVEKPKQPVQPQKKDNTQPQPAKKAENPKPSTSTNTAANNRVKNAFGKNNGTGTGKAGVPGGADNGGTAGAPGVGGLDGYTLEYFPRAKCPAAGTVRIRVTVSPSGAVSKASIVGGSVTDQRTRDICLGLARQSRFRVPKGQSIERTGTLTYTIR